MDPPSADGTTALVVLVPEAEGAVGTLRRRWDPSAARGMAAHVTVLYPFVPEPRWTDDVDRRVASVCDGAAPFVADFRSTGSFGPGSLHLVPEPSAPFVALTRALAAEFPDCPPYGGAFATIIPHLTLADGAAPADVDAAAAAWAAVRPFQTRVAEIALVAKRGGVWRFRKRWPLGAAAPEIVLRGCDTDEVRLGVASYEFAGPDAGLDWLEVRGAFAHRGRRWHATAPCVTTVELREFADWLGNPDGRLGEWIEPCLRFSARRDGGLIRLRIGVSQGFHPLPGDVAASPWSIDLEVLPESLADAARDAWALCARFPDRSGADDRAP